MYNVEALREAVAEMAVEHPTDEDLITWAVESYLQDFSEEELVENVVNSTTFAEHFFPTASAVLREGGVFTYMTNEIDSISREHQRLVLQHFRSFTLRVIEDLSLPADVKDAWWANSMAIIRAEK